MISHAHNFDSQDKLPGINLELLQSRKLPADFAVSPSLVPMADLRLPAHEMKFLVTEAVALQIENMLSGSLTADPHARPTFGLGGYRTTTIYCDTPDFDVYFRQGRFRRRKYRLRRYCDDPVVYLERKLKRGTQVQKQRSPLPLNDVVRLAGPEQDVLWDGDWFHRHVLNYGLAPVLAVQYQRTAYCGFCHHEPVRLTFDRDIAGMLTKSWITNPFEGGQTMFQDHVICEFKYRGDMPGLFKAVIEELRLSPASSSKYRTCLAGIYDSDLLGGRHV